MPTPDEREQMARTEVQVLQEQVAKVEGVREPILQFFRCDHLPVDLQEVSRPFQALANATIMALPRNPERTVALRKLLESKDAAVRAALYQP